jgi:hypothetical protein
MEKGRKKWRWDRQIRCNAVTEGKNEDGKEHHED